MARNRRVNRPSSSQGGADSAHGGLGTEPMASGRPISDHARQTSNAPHAKQQNIDKVTAESQAKNQAWKKSLAQDANILGGAAEAYKHTAGRSANPMTPMSTNHGRTGDLARNVDNRPNETQTTTVTDSFDRSADWRSGIQDAEEQAQEQPEATPTQTAEQAALDDRTGGLASRARNFGKQFWASGSNRKKTYASGGLGAAVVALLILFGGLASTELVGWRENMINGKGNEIINTVMEKRMQRSFARVANKLARGALTNAHNTINDAKFKENFERRGYRVVFDEEGKLTEFAKLDEDGEIARNFNLDDPNPKNALTEFTEGELGLTIKDDLRQVMLERAATWKGRAARKVWNSIRVRFFNWADRKTSDKADTDEKKLSENMRIEQAEQNADAPERTRVRSDDEQRDTDGDGTPESELSDPSSDLGQESQEYGEKLLDDPGLDDTGAIDGIVEPDLIEDMTRRAPGTFDAVLAEASDDAVRSALGDLAVRMPGKLAGAAVTGISVSDWYNRLCRLTGTAKFVANVKNVLLAIGLARIAFMYLTEADHQKAGALSSEGLNLVMTYLHTPNPANGRGYYESGGIQNLIGNRRAKVNPVNLGRYSTGRANAGIMAQIAGFIESNPLTRYGVNPTVCRITNNGVVQILGAGIGVVVAVFGGSETGITQAQIATSIGLALAEELVFQVSKPLLLKVGSGIILNGLERNGEQVGDAMASGVGVTKMMGGGANGLKPVTWDQATLIRGIAQKDRKTELARMNPIERYLDFKNPDSLTSKAYFAAPKNFTQLFGKLPNLIQPERLANGLVGSVMPQKVAWAQAEADSQCEDPWIREQHLATDAFCNVEMGNDAGALDVDESEEVLLGANQIDVDGTPIPGSEYEKFINRCHSGAASVVYKTDVSDAGTENATDTTCLTPGEPLPGDSVGKHDRFTNFYGYMSDEANISEEINDKYIDVAAAVGQDLANPGGQQVAGGVCNPDIEPVDRNATDSAGRPVLANPDGSLSNILVNSCMLQQVNAMVKAAAKDGVNLTASNSWRDPQQQIQLRREHCGDGYYNIYVKPSSQCSPPTARPGRSMHERGMAIDFSNCGSRGTQCYIWLNQHAAQYGLQNLPSEAWHWSVNGN